MTGPTIPADEWPEGAVALVWSAVGLGKWVAADSSTGTWEVDLADVPMPAGWDWRVPVMRPASAQAKPVAFCRDGVLFWHGDHAAHRGESYDLYATPQQPPALDPGQLRKAVEGATNFIARFSWAWDGTGQHPNTIHTELQAALALIDGQAAIAAPAVADEAVRRLVRAMEDTPGDELIEPNTRLCRRLLAAALQPTKGEGE